MKANNLDDIDRLRESLNRLKVPEKTIPFKGLPVMDHGFFPGGNGLHRGINATRLPIRGTLVLGSNFGRCSDFVKDNGQLVRLDERGGRTWKPLLENFENSEINKEECFFTNALPFLHEGNSNLGPVEKWLKNPSLMDSCLTFFDETLKILQPKLIVALGACRK